MTEKYDGVRAYWDGKKLISKQGGDIPCPAEFVENLPKVPLDGELWIERNSFHRMNGVLHSNDKGLWRDVKYVVFDLPGSPHPFETRMEELRKLSLPSNVQLVEPVRCRDMTHLKEHMGSLLKLGAEGLMLSEPGSLYTPGRRGSLLKIKVGIQVLTAKAIRGFRGASRRDPASRAHVSPVFCFSLCSWIPRANGVKCAIPCFLQVRENPPAVGSVVTVKHTGYYSTGTLKFPYFWRARTDMTWEQVLRSQPKGIPTGSAPGGVT